MCINVKTGAKRLEIKEYIKIMKNGVRYIVIDQYRSQKENRQPINR